jgi:hypothetical protein
VQEHLMTHQVEGFDWVQGCWCTKGTVPGYMQHSSLPPPLPRLLRHPRGGSPGVPAAPSGNAWPWCSLVP